MSLKAKLKKNKLIYSVNAFFKSRKMKAGIQALNEKYAPLTAGIADDEAVVFRKLAEKLRERGIVPGKNKKPRIFWIGANFAQDDSGFLQALDRHSELHTFRNSKGEYGQEFTSDRFNQEIVKRNSNELLRQVEKIQNEVGPIDIVMGQVWANYISPEALRKIQDMKIITLNVSMDDRLPELWEVHEGHLMGAVGLVEAMDLTLTTSPECPKRFMYHGGLAIFWPLASDSSLFRPAPVKDIDVSFVGNNYGIRGQIIKTLQNAGITVTTFGPGWPNGAVNASEATQIFNRSKIIFGIGTIGYCTDVFTIKLRDFDATMAGALYITHRNPDLLQLFKEGEEIECYADAHEAARKIKHYLAHPEKIEKIGKAAAEKARTLHTWDQRISTLLRNLGY